MLELVDIHKNYEARPLLAGVNLAVAEGETVCLLGSSGSGKSTLLRIVAGLEQPDSGRVLWDGEDLSRVPAHRRGFGLMFQDYALFPHLNVAENVAFGLRMQNQPEDRIRSETQAALRRVDLEGFARRAMAGLSGGEQQRVALARTLAPRPRLLMLDEPLGALDRALREQLADQLRRLLADLRIPSLYVTHDQEEAFAVAQRVALLHEGRIVQADSPENLVNYPASKWAANFLGLGNLLRAGVRKVRPLTVRTPLGEFEAECRGPRPVAGDEGWILLPPGGGVLRRGGSAAAGEIRGEVIESVWRGGAYRILLRCGGEREIFCNDIRPAEEGERRIWRPGKGFWIRG
ncbi:MAG: ABC transporter ATP-binding protein [Anaerolineales bacterium]|nr:ABC transporter ATP-binding protein [Anaerolineales bacterium]